MAEAIDDDRGASWALRPHPLPPPGSIVMRCVDSMPGQEPFGRD